VRQSVWAGRGRPPEPGQRAAHLPWLQTAPSYQGLFDRTASPAVDVLESTDMYTVLRDLPGVDQKIVEEKEKVIIRLEMPGVEKNGLEMKIDKNELSIVGRHLEKAAEGEYLLRERRDGDYYQVYTLDDTIDRNKIDASLVNGILRVTLHLKEAEKPRKITVKSN